MPDQDRRDTADVTGELKELHRIVNEAIRAAAPGEDHAEGLTVDLSRIEFAKLRDEFASKVRRKHAALQDIRDVIEEKLAQMLARNPMRMDFYRKYQEIIADYNREKDRVTRRPSRNWLRSPPASTPKSGGQRRRASATTSWPCSTCSSGRASARPTASGSSRPAGRCSPRYATC